MRSSSSLETHRNQWKILYSTHLPLSNEYRVQGVQAIEASDAGLLALAAVQLFKGEGFVRMSAIYSLATNMISNRKLGMWEMDRIRVSK